MFNRREFLGRSALGTMIANLSDGAAKEFLAPAPNPPYAAEEVLPGTDRLTMQGDLAWQMVENIHRFLLRETQAAATDRSKLWQRDHSSPEAYRRSVAPNLERLRHITGVVDKPAPASEPAVLGTLSFPGQIVRGPGYEVFAVRWPVLEPVVPDFGGLEAEGLLVNPLREPVARVVAIPDADWTPEMLIGLAPGVPPAAQFARHLAESGCQVIVPLLINRDDTFSGSPGIRMTNQPHREWIYRMAFQAGRHIIGFEIQKVLAAIDWFVAENEKHSAPIGVIGYGEGGLLAFYSAALDNRIHATLVSGYFQEREGLWKEPIYREVWGVVREFGDAEMASLVAPRALVIEASRGPEVSGPPPVTKEHPVGACPNGTLVSPPLDSVKREFDRARQFFQTLKEDQLQLVVSGDGQGSPGSEAALDAFMHSLGANVRIRFGSSLLTDPRKGYDPNVRLRRQFDNMVGFTQAVIRKSPDRLQEFWAKADSTSTASWKESTRFYRDYVWEEVHGRLPAPSMPPNPRSRLIYDEPKYRAYEVVLDVWPDVFDYGILLIPKDVKSGERRPAVVCQHGLEGRPTDVADPNNDVPRSSVNIYHRFAVRLAELGFVVYAPQNPYIGNDHFRIIQRMGHPIKLSIFSFILGQHEQMLNWLSSQSFVDPDRIGFYGLSYGGRTAVHVPPLLERYALSVCSGDFNENTWKTTGLLHPYSYMPLPTYDAFYFNAANVANYGELASLMAPRPFMVERGNYDPVSLDQWVSHEFGKLRRLYDNMGISDRTVIEFFNGVHEIRGVGTFEFLGRHLQWPEKLE